MTELTAQQERKRAADRAFARRRKAGSEGRNPALVDGDPQPLVRISLLVNPLPRVPGARCTARPDLFFSSDPEEITAAIFLCQGCPGRTACLRGARERGEDFGVWGGADFDREHRVRKDTAA